MNHLTREQMETVAPSAFAIHPSPIVSEKYVFLNTLEIVNVFESRGWLPIMAGQSRARKPEKQGFQKHLLRFRKENFEFKVNSAIPEIVLKNSHDRSSALEFFLGIFNCVCLNGLIISRLQFESLYLKHFNIGSADVDHAINLALVSFTSIEEKIMEYQHVVLNNDQKNYFAALTHEQFKLRPEINSSTLLTPRRKEDENNTLWTVFNVIQENLLKGGIGYKTVSNRNMRTRTVKNIDKEIDWNTMLWTLLATMYRKTA